MDQDFASAAVRHMSDASRLLEAERPDNAAYLAGYVAECGIKAVVEHGGHQLWGHLREITDTQLLLVSDLSLALRRYPLDLDAEVRELQTTWSTELRYAPTGSIDSGDAEKIVSLADHCMRRTIDQLVLDGALDRMPT